VAIVSTPMRDAAKRSKRLSPEAAVPGQVSGEQIIEWARGRLAAYKVPRSVRTRRRLPRSGAGKIQWRALPERGVGRGRVRDRD
jgi:acyl-CoA synthetase (AMP-forming)/AMP-acid ligase II